METKRCSQCEEIKALTEFNIDKGIANNLRAQCKVCQYAVQERRHWQEHYKPEAKEKAREAYETGKLQKPLFCEICGKVKPLDRHHPNYKKPLKVIWVCRKCHSAAHKLPPEVRSALANQSRPGFIAIINRQDRNETVQRL